MDSVFFAIMHFPLKKARLISYFEKTFLENSLELPLIFVFLKGKQNYKENPKCDSLYKKQVCEKPSLGSRVWLLIGKVQ